MPIIKTNHGAHPYLLLDSRREGHHQTDTVFSGCGGPITARRNTMAGVTVTKQQRQADITTKNINKQHKDPDIWSKKTTSDRSCACAKTEGEADNNLEKFKDSCHPEDVSLNAAAEDRVCARWMSGDCIQAEKCRFLHSWVSNEAKTDIAKIARLTGHKKAVSGIALPPGSEILYTAGRDGTLRSWDAHTGKCLECIDFEAEIGCMICQGSWMFVGIPYAIWACNSATSQSLRLEGPRGQVNAMGVSQDALFAACEDGNILTYEPNRIKKTFVLTATPKGHNKAVLSLAFSKDHVYSGSEDRTIRRWDSLTFRCTHVLEGHSGAVASLIRWENYLFTGSLDNKLKVWGSTEEQGFDDFRTHDCKQGVIAFTGTTNAAAKPVLLVSSSDNYVCIYEPVPNKDTIKECGRIYTTERVTTLASSGILLFTGDASGNVDVWKWLDQPGN